MKVASVRLWEQIALAKVAHIQKSLETRPEGLVFSVFANSVSRLLRDVVAVIPTHSGPEHELARSKLIIALDDLALYMRFLETASGDVPTALKEHALDVFARIEPHDLVLLRPQNVQTFDTEGVGQSLQSFLSSLIRNGFVRIALDREISGPLVRDLTAEPNIHIVSYPKYLGEYLPFFPLLGHEFGHVLHSTSALQGKLRSLIDAQIAEAYRRIPIANAQRKELQVRNATDRVVERWALEYFADLIGLRIYGESYLYALWLHLLDQPEVFNEPPWSEYLVSAARFGLPTKRIHARGPGKDPATQFRFPSHPSTSHRLRFLFAQKPNLVEVSRDAPRFSEWRETLRRVHRQRARQYRDPVWEACAREARAIALLAYEDVSPRMKRLNSSTTQKAVSGMLKDWKRHVPPIQIRGTELAPATWRDFLLVATISILEGYLEPDAPSGGQAAQFLYQSFEMLNLYRRFHDTKRIWQLDTPA